MQAWQGVASSDLCFTEPMFVRNKKGKGVEPLPFHLDEGMLTETSEQSIR